MPTTRRESQERGVLHGQMRARGHLRPLLLLLLLTLLAIAVAGCDTSAQPVATPVKVATLPTVSGSDWTMYHRDPARSGYVSDTPDPHQLTRAWSMDLDGSVYAEPLVVGGMVIVATEANTLYALDARTGEVHWHTNVGTPVSRDDLPCGNISPLGITGTPVYDPATRLVFAVAELSGANGAVGHTLVGVDVATGQVRMRRSADPPGIDPRTHQQRAALALAGNLVYVAYGGLFGDCGKYHGLVVASRTDGQGALLSYQVPTTREGGIWATPGPVFDPSGSLYVSVGNGEATSGKWDHTDSVLRLSPQLQLQDGFAPTSWPEDNARDADLGSMAPVLLADGWIVAAGKSGQGYLLRADHLGGVGGQVQELQLCHAFGGAATVGTRAFLPCTDGVREVQVENGKLTLGWHASSQIPGSPVVGGHTVYSMGGEGVLYALDSESGKVRTSLAVGAASRFATPTIVGSALFVGTLAGVVAVQIA
jgi:outer membrane protein assembly factor BamB